MTVKRIALFLLAIMLAFCGAAAAESETFRNGKVLETTGSAIVVRSSYEMPVYEQMMIQSGDQVETAADGWVVLCVDDDKYLILEPETKVLFELEGDARRCMIRLQLLQGAVYTEIENPLSDGDGYEITTADGVMAVRGTNFRASHETDEENRQRHTEIQLFFGELEVSTDHEPPQTEVLTGGEEIGITTPLDENGAPAGESELGDKSPLDMDDLPEEYDRDKLKEPEALFGQEDDSQESAPVCSACGQEIINADDHAPVKSLSKYCKEQHYRCTDMMHYCDPNHDYNPDKNGVQEGCGDEYGCKSSNAHTLCRMCGDMWCDYDNGGHETACGNAYHRPCQINQNGYYRKSGHASCPYGCNGYLCDGALHGTGSGQCSPVACTYCTAEAVQHDTAPCGQHCTAQSGDHTECICGGWACVGTHGEMECGHYCKQSEIGHEACPYGCGGYLCDGNTHSEELCGNAASEPCWACGDPNSFHDPLACDSHCTAQAQDGNHTRCAYCEDFLCSGDSHGDGVCNVLP